MTQERALAIGKGVYAPEHPEVARTLSNLGLVQERLDEFDAARVIQQRALAIKEVVYGPAHPEVASTLQPRASCTPSSGGLRQRAWPCSAL